MREPFNLNLQERMLPNLSALLKIVPRSRWTAPLLLMLGTAASFAEAASVSLTVLFVYLMLHRVDLLVATSGVLGGVFRFAMAHLHTSNAIFVCIVSLVLLRSAAQYGYAMLGAKLGESMSEKLQNRVHDYYLRVSFATFQSQPQGNLVNTLGREAWFVADSYIMLVRIYVNVVCILVLAISLLLISARMMICVSAATSLVYVGINALTAKSHRVGKELRQIWQKLWDHIMVSLEGMRSIRAFGQEAITQRRFTAITEKARIAGVESKRVTALLDPLGDAGLLAILVVIVTSAKVFHIDFSAVLAFVALLGRMEPQVRDFERGRIFLSEKEPQLASLRSILESGELEFAPEGTREVDALRDRIRFSGIQFRYPGEVTAALQDVSFDIPVGATTALVGASGSGKSTIVNLLLKLYTPSAGEITIDGVPLEELRRTEWLKLVALAGQDVDLVEGTVNENIKLANLDATDEQIFAALDLVGAAELVESLRGGADSWIGPHASRFSGGQRQRIGLARAVLHDPQLLILDEAMSAMDATLEQRVRRALDCRFEGRTLLLITHRLETILTAEHVVYLQEGRVIGEGRPQDMLNDPNSPLSKALAAKS